MTSGFSEGKKIPQQREGPVAFPTKNHKCGRSIGGVAMPNRNDRVERGEETTDSLAALVGVERTTIWPTLQKAKNFLKKGIRQ